VVDRSEIGVFSASMDEKQVKKYTIGTIQSIYKKPELFDHYSVAIIDECHLYNPKKLSGMYNKFFRAIGNPIVFGLTATPYRQDILYEYPGGWSNYHGHKWQKMQMEAITTTKMITRYKEKFWDRMLYVANTIDLQNEGYLCPLRYFDLTMIDQDQIPLNKSKSDFNLDLYEELLAGREREIVNVLSQLSKQHKSLLVFCATIKQAQRLSSVLKGSRSIRNDVPPLQTPVCDFVSCHTPKKEREQLIKDFREAGGILFNVGILTTGFNYNQLEAIALIRPTRSLNLYNQMIGRVTRVKDTGVGYVYDFSGTVKKLGRIETIQVTKNSGQWDVVSETKKGGFHLKKLYSYRIGS
jgi:DNA repair protein RadD